MGWNHLFGHSVNQDLKKKKKQTTKKPQTEKQNWVTLHFLHLSEVMQLILYVEKVEAVWKSQRLNVFERLLIWWQMLETPKSQKSSTGV